MCMLCYVTNIILFYYVCMYVCINLFCSAPMPFLIGVHSSLMEVCVCVCVCVVCVLCVCCVCVCVCCVCVCVCV